MKKILHRINTIVVELEVMILHVICDNIPSHYLRRFFCRLGGIKIGKGSTLHMGIRFYDPKNISIGEDSIIGENSVLDGRDKLVIGNHVDIATGVMIYNSEHDINDPNFHAIQAQVTVQDYVFVGPRAIILPGVTIGKGAVVGAGAIVTKDVQEYSIVGGVPAKEIGKRKIKELNYRLGRAAWFR
jgi:acetyltransferase-like isoleucine patch superfamily enzyme